MTVPLLKDGTMDYAIAADVDSILAQALQVAAAEDAGGSSDSTFLDFSVHTRFNLPAAAGDSGTLTKDGAHG